MPDEIEKAELAETRLTIVEDGPDPIANQPDTPIYLNAKQIAQNLGVTYDRLLGFAKQPGMDQAIGAVNVKGVKGVRYTEASQQLFAHLIAEQDAGRLTPSSAVATLLATKQEDVSTALVQQANSPLSQQLANRHLPESFLTDEQVHRINDRVLTAQEAAEFLRVSVQHLKDYGPKPFIRYGKSARGDRWRLSDLLRQDDTV